MTLAEVLGMKGDKSLQPGFAEGYLAASEAAVRHIDKLKDISARQPRWHQQPR